MPVNIEIKGNLARLLATENLIVEHKQVETAQFNTQTRVLTLPMWNTASNYVYDMLVAHEVGHALFTPCTMWKEGKYESLPHGYVNIIEDARIERLMKNKFAGLNKDFYKGYEELNANDFFELNGKNINDMKFIDKINLYFKLGAFLCLEFNDIENQFITEISQSESFDDVLDISNRVYQYSKEQQEARQKEQEQEQASDITEGEDSDLSNPSYERDYQAESDDEIDDEADIDDPEFDPSDNLDTEQGAGQEAGDWNNIDESDTQEAFDSNSQKLQDNNGQETTYVTIPEMNLDNVVIPFDTINDYLTEHFTVTEAGTGEADPNSYYYRGNGIKADTREFREYKKSASKDVNHLVKEFEMKKSADSYARQATARTGVLDTSKLHTYMFNEDIFKKITVIPEGKNHGLVFLLDWSGSMNNILENTMKQLFNLVWFCKKVNIPFEVYAFTNDAWSLDPDMDGLRQYDIKPDRLVKEMKENAMHIEGAFRMVNILTSTAKTKDFDRMILNLWLQTRAMKGAMYTYARKFCLSGTPLNEAIVSAGQLTKQFIKTAKLQKCHVIVLTDGEGYHASMNQKRTSYYSGQEEMCVTGISPWNSTIRVGSKSYISKGSDVEFTNKLVEAVKSDIPNCSFIGIRILEKGSSRYFYERHARLSFTFFEDMKDQLRKNGAVFFRNKSFDLWCGIQQHSLHTDTELEVDQGAAKRQITAAFKKMNKNKKSNKFMVKEFIKQIA
tara:strand:- start:60 stop:2249 length:2190 start_codon:yes stop_codon:yes gene_type:complete